MIVGLTNFNIKQNQNLKSIENSYNESLSKSSLIWPHTLYEKLCKKVTNMLKR